MYSSSSRLRKLQPWPDVAVEAAGLVLGQDEDLAQAAVDAVGQGEVDDAVQAAERDGRLGPVAGERLEPRAPAAGQDDGQDVTHGRSPARLIRLPAPRGAGGEGVRRLPD